MRLLALCVVLLLMPVSAQQSPSVSTPTSLYFHIFDTFNQFPINTQPQEVEFFEVGGTNFPTTNHQVPGQHPFGPYGPYDFNTIYGWSTAGPVEYDFIENGRPRFHPERGIASEVIIDAGVQPIAYLYADVRDFAGGDTAPQMTPAFTFRVTMREGDAAGDVEQLNQGQVIMAGQVTYHLYDDPSGATNDQMDGQTGPDDVPVITPDGQGIFEIAVPLTIESSTIPKEKAFNIRIDWYQEVDGAIGPDEFAEGWLWLAMDSAHRPRLDFAIMNPIYIDFIHPQVAAGTLLIHTGVNSPWGTYDVDVANMTVEITGPSTPQTVRQVITQNQHVHGLHDQAAEITYLWKFREENAANGDYRISVRVSNMAGNAVASGTAEFKVEGKRAYGIDDQDNIVEPVDDAGGKDTPGPAALLGALVLLGVAASRRWRA